MEPVELALKYIHDQDFIDGFVVGVCSLSELEQLWKRWKELEGTKKLVWKEWALSNNSLLEPRCWN